MKIIFMRNKLIILGLFLLLFGLFSRLTKPVLAVDETCSLDNLCETSPSADIDGQNNGDFSQYAPEDHENKVCIYYFFGAGCKACASIQIWMNDLAARYSDQIELKSYEIYHSDENRALFEDFTSRYQVENSGVPAAFIGDTYLGGADTIKSNLENKIGELASDNEVCPLSYNRIEGKTEEPKKLKITLPAIIIGALADSINPCAFAVLVFLIVYLTAVKDKKTMLRVGLVYIGSVFVVYFASGLGLLQLAQYMQFSGWVFKVIATLTILAGVINIKDFFWYGKGFSLQIPDSKKPILERYIRQASVPAAIVLGFLVSAFELPCTGGVYLAVLGILSQEGNSIYSYFYLTIYNLIFVLPLLIILLTVYFGLDPDKVNNWRLDQRKWLRLVMGLIMVGLGMALFIGLF